MPRDFAKKFYRSKQWLDIREFVYRREFGICQICGDIESNSDDFKNDHMEVHHNIWLTPDNINDVDIALNPDNLMLLCRNCHMNIHKEFRIQKRIEYNQKKSICELRVMFDADGNVINKEVK